jgi:hypothetical protein
MPRTCLACASSGRREIDGALATGEPLRNIAKRVSISPAALLRHKAHLAQAIVKASEKREERLGDGLLDDMRRVQLKAWELLGRTEADGDHRASIVALREVRECLESLGEMLSRAAAAGGGGAEIVCRIIALGQPPTHEWEALPSSYNELLPGKPKGRLYLVREHVRDIEQTRKPALPPHPGL